MGTPCRIIPNAEIAKRLGLKENESISFADFTMKVREGLLDDFDNGGNEPPTPSSEAEAPKEPRYEGFRKDVLSDVQNRFKTAPTSFIDMMTNGLAKLKLRQGESIFDGTRKVANKFLSSLKKGDAIVMNTAETAQMMYYLTELRTQENALLEKGIDASNSAIWSAIKSNIEDAEAIFGAAGQEQARAFAMRQIEAEVPMEQRIKIRRMEILAKEGLVESDVVREASKLDEDIRKELELAEENNKKLAAEYEAKLKEQAEKHAIELAEARKKTKQAGISEQAKEKRAYAKRALDVLDKLEKKLKGKTYSDLGATSIAITGIRLIKTGIKAGLKIEEAIDKAIETLDKTYKNWKRDEFKQDMLDGFAGIEQQEGKIDNGMLREVVEAMVEEGRDVEDITINDIIGKLKEDYFGDKTEDEIRDLITGYGKTKEITKDAVDTTIAYAKTIGRLISQIKDAEEGVRPKKATTTIKEETPEAKEEREAKVSSLRKQLNEALKNIPIDEETRQNQLKTAQDRITTHLTNSIKELEEQIAKGEKKPARKTIEYNEVNKALRKQRDDLRAELNKLVAKDNIPLEEKIRRAVKGIETSERNWERRIKEKEWNKPTKEVLSDPRIDEAKAKRDARKAEFERLKAESLPPIDKKAQLIGDIADEASKSGATTLTNEMVKKGLVADLLNQKIEEGFRGSEVFDEMMRDLSAILPNVDMKDIHEAVLGEGMYKQPTKASVENEIKTKENEVKAIASLKKQISDLLEFGIQARGKTEKEILQEIKDLKEQKKEALKNAKQFNTITELNQRMAAIDGRIELWEKELKDPKEKNFFIEEAKARLKEKLISSGLAVDSEKLTNKKKLDSIIDSVNEGFKKIRYKYESASPEVKSQVDSLIDILTGTVERRTDLIRNKKRDIKRIADQAAMLTFKEGERLSGKNLSSELNALLKDIELQEEAFKVEKATENFIGSTERSIARNRRDLIAGRFAESFRGNPIVNATTIKLGIEKKRSERALRLAEERFIEKTQGATKRFANDYVTLYRQGLISGVRPIEKIGVSGLLRPAAETLRRSLYGVVSKTVLRNIGVARGEGLSVSSTLKAHGGLLKLFNNEAKVAELRKEANDSFEKAKAAFQVDPSEANRIALQEASKQYAFSTIYDFVDANNLTEFGNAIIGKKTKLQEAFAMDKGMTLEEVETTKERIFHFLDTLGRVHGALKNSLSGRAEFMRSFMLDIEQGVKAGEDVTSPENLTIYADRALLANKDATYQTDNVITQNVNRFVQDLTKNREKLTPFQKGVLGASQLYLKLAYPIVKTPMNIWMEGSLQYTLGLPIAAGLHINKTIKGYQEAAKQMQTATFREKWAEMAENMSKLDEKTKREIGMYYTKGGVGAMILGMTLAGLIKKDDDDEWEMFGVHFGKGVSSAISHFSLLMPPMYMAEFLHAYEKQEKKNERHPDEYESPYNKGASAMAGKMIEENVYLKPDNKSETNITRTASALIPSIGTMGDLIKMSLDYEYDPQTIADFQKTAWGVGYFTKDVPIRKKVVITDVETKKELSKVGYEVPVIRISDYESKRDSEKPIPYIDQVNFLEDVNNKLNQAFKDNLNKIKDAGKVYVTNVANKIPDITKPELDELEDKFIKEHLHDIQKSVIKDAADLNRVRLIKERTIDEKKKAETISEIKQKISEKLGF